MSEPFLIRRACAQKPGAMFDFAQTDGRAALSRCVLTPGKSRLFPASSALIWVEDGELETRNDSGRAVLKSGVWAGFAGGELGNCGIQNARFWVLETRSEFWARETRFEPLEEREIGASILLPLAGVFEATVGDARLQLGSGDWLCLPPGFPICLRALCDGAARVLSVGIFEASIACYFEGDAATGETAAARNSSTRFVTPELLRSVCPP